MSIKVKVRQGDYTQPEADLTSQAPTIEGTSTPKIQVGHAYGAGQQGTGQVTFMDRTGLELPSGGRPAGRRLTTVIEDVTGCDRWIFRGRVADLDVGRGPRKGGNNAEWDGTFFDGNNELRGQAFSEEWVRPQESPYDRLVALQAYTLNGTASTSPTARGTAVVVVSDAHLCKDDDGILLDAKTYPPMTEPQDVVEDCRIAAGKDYGVVLHEGPAPSVAPATIESSKSGANPRDGVIVDGSTVDRALVVFVLADTFPVTSVNYYTDGGLFSGLEAMSQIGSPVVSSNVGGGQIELSAWLLVNPTADIGSGGRGGIKAFWSGGTASGAIAAYVLSDARQTGTVVDDASASVSYSTSSISTAISGANATVLDALAYLDLWGAIAYSTPGAGQTVDEQTGEGSASFGSLEYILQTSHQDSASAMSWSGIPVTDTAPPNWDFTGSSQIVVAIAGAGGGASGDCDHLCLQHVFPTDLATNASICKISDQISEFAPLDPTNPVFFAEPDQGKYTHADHESLDTGLVYGYQTKTGSGFIFTEHAPSSQSYDRWIEGVSDSEVETPAEAALRATATLLARRLAHITHKFSVRVNADQVHLLRAGMAVQMKLAAAQGEEYLGVWQTRRIASVLVEPFVDGPTYRYKLTLNLDRPLRIVPTAPSVGAAVGDPSKATVVTGGGTGAGGTQTVQDAITGLEGAPTRTRALTNKSGGSVAAGDVVVIDTANNDAFTTTTTASETRVIGVAMETIANNATGLVALEGYVPLINVTASVTRGHYAFTSTTVKKASGASARAAGAFAQFAKGGTTPDGVLFGVPDASVASFSLPAPASDGLFAVSDSGTLAWANVLVDDGDVVTDDGNVVYELV